MRRIRLTAFMLLFTLFFFTLPAFAQAALPLDNGYSSSDEKAVFGYPDNWKIDVSDADSSELDVNVGTSDDVLHKDPVNNSSDVFAPGQVRVNIVTGKKDDLAKLAGVSADVGIAEILTNLLKKVGSTNVKFEPVQEFVAGDIPFVRVAFSATGQGDGFILLRDLSGGIIGGIALYTAPGEVPKWDATAQSIAASLDYSGADEPTPEATTEGTSGVALDLTQNFISSDGNLAFKYPADWVTEDANSSSSSVSVNIATSQGVLHKDPLNNAGDVLASGDARINLGIAQKSEMAHFAGLNADDSIADILPKLFEQASSEKVQFGTVEEIQVGEYPAAFISYTAPGQADGFVLLVDFGSGEIGALALYTAPGELSRWKATGLGIAASITHANAVEATPEATSGAALNLTQNFSGEAGKVTFNYPSGWVINVNPSPAVFSVTIASSQRVSSTTLDPQTVFAPGEVAIQLQVQSESTLLSLPGVKADSTPVEILDAFFAADTLPPDMSIGKSSAISINNQPGAQVHLTEGNNAEGSITLLRYSDGAYVLMAVVAAPGELSNWSATGEAVLASLSLNEAAPTVVPTETSHVALDLTETFTTENKSSSFNYPAGWTVKDSSGFRSLDVVIGSTEAASSKQPGGSDVFAPGEVAILIQTLTEDEVLSTPGMTANSTPVDLLEATIKQAGTPSTGMTVGEVTATSINDLAAAQVHIDQGKTGEGIAILLRYKPDIYLVMAMFAAPGELSKWEATGRAILGSVSVNPEVVATPEPPLPTIATLPTLTPTPAPLTLSETINSANSAINVSYPPDWVTSLSGSQGIYLANSDKALNHQLGNTFAPGEIQILFRVGTIANLTPGIDLGLSADATPMKTLQAFMKATKSFLTFDTPEDTTVRGMTAATVVLHGNGYDGRSILIAMGGNNIGLVQVLTAPGELPDWEDTIQAIVNTFHYPG